MLGSPATALFLGYWAWFHLPNLACVFRNRAIARKLPGAGDVQDCFLRPSAGFGIERAEPFLCLAIRGQICQVYIMIALSQKRIAQGSEYSWLIAAEVIRENEVERSSNLRLILIVPMRVVPGAARLDLLHREPEQEHVLFSGFLRHFDGGAVAGSDRQSSVHHKFHVTRSAGLVAGGRDLVGDIAGWNQPFRQRNVVLREKDDVEPAARRRVSVNRARQVVDELYDELGQLVSWRRLTGEEKCPRHCLHAGIFPQPVINDHNPQRIHQLPLIFVNTLNVAVEDGVGIDDTPRRCLEPIGKLHFGLSLGLEEAFASIGILREWLEMFE